MGYGIENEGIVKIGKMYLENKQLRTRITELEAELEEVKQHRMEIIDNLATVETERDRYREALANIIKHQEIAGGTKYANTLSTVTLIARKALENK